MNWIELNNQVIIKNEQGKYQLEKDREALSSYIEEFIQPKLRKFNNLEERLKYLIDEGYYSKEVINQYSMDFIKNIYEIIDKQKFEFQSYMSANKFYQNYALKSNDGKEILETYNDKVLIVALTLGNGNKDLVLNLADKIVKQEFQPATPTFLNAGRKRAGEMVSCFLLSVEDSTEGISYAISSSNHLSKIGGGVALNLSKLRASGESIKDIEGAAGGVVGVAKMLEQSFSYFNQMGARQGSGAVYLTVFHPDFELLMDTKKINADEKIRLATLSLGAIIPDKFMELAEKNEVAYAFYPHTVYKKYGVSLDEIEMNKWYDKLVNDNDIRKKEINPRQMLTKIAQMQQESGYPYVVYIDTANREHTLKDIGIIKMSNLCCEIFQYQTHSEIEGYGGKNEWGQDISCNLGSLNIANVMDNKTIESTVETAIRALSFVADSTDIKPVPTVSNSNSKSHSIGLGAMNLHGYLVRENILYTSDDAIDFSNVFFAMVRYYSIKASMKIAIEKNQTFEGFDKSEYAKGRNSKVLSKYYEQSYLPKSEKVKALFEGIYIPTKEDWTKLLDEVKEKGIYNAYLMAIAPTQSISYVQNSTSSIMPITEPVEVRTYGDSTTIYPMPFLTNDNILYYQSAYRMDMRKVIDLVATVQNHVDQGISTTLFVTDEKTTRDIARHYIYAYKKGLKSLYYTRTKMTRDTHECLVCSV
ncbi:ribonucleoside-diphosphate reductase subunit alpha (Ribonucleotide reductase large subunit) [Clostridioides difficile]|uniref:class 1b ribonucleoside-diphosphate reductase subunit alpha n=1 Tax=Clostridioides difficile TaxID=1496 RepID=UPI000D1E7244|nr:class 1b ribonucleoside-diphosphate reductase subunit alpha [Clostridioides difficile]EGT2204503.1 class 1b ribonucleoside-diphosphate reductase subunit alpha [Clostridioides difficile]EGT4666000.1 class 1b ribonucleoside-diphosphate reductase subunit alpha [Clostridioides difficile]UUV15831.1 class 1b ribonucleoside-diphosphate reductase subunit alpha [Clostridioides difficile]UWD41576.1 class 1b ribonucleoside-diphosphate reductase subunit alpha [Clostridioides difficile]UWD45217.1 class 